MVSENMVISHFADCTYGTLEDGLGVLLRGDEFIFSIDMN